MSSSDQQSESQTERTDEISDLSSENTESISSGGEEDVKPKSKKIPQSKRVSIKAHEIENESKPEKTKKKRLTRAKSAENVKNQTRQRKRKQKNLGDDSNTDESGEKKAVTPSPSKTKLDPSQDTSDDISISTSDEEPATHPVNSVQKILAHRVNSDGSFDYLLKLHGVSYRKCDWASQDFLESTLSGHIMLQKYRKLHPNQPPDPPYYPPAYDIPEKIIGSMTADDGPLYLVKWSQLDYDQATWEVPSSIDDESLIKTFEESTKLPSLSDRFVPPHPSPSDWKPLTSVEGSKNGLTARQYQIEGLNFLVNSWYNKRNAILADEMGLGKTLQTILFLNYLSKYQKIKGPFLVIAPLSTLPHWEREIADWSDLHSLPFYGPKERRTLMKQYEMFYPTTNLPRFNIILTTYEYIIKEQQLFSGIQWRCLAVDEAHRLKNTHSKLISILRTYKSDFKLLLTGTPLQNSTAELWTLLNFLDTTAFESLSEFQEKFGQLSESEQIVELQSILKPLMLRRLKSDVEKSLAPLEEVIIECAMTRHQKTYYKSILSKNVEYLTRGAHRDNSTNLVNIFMELRKVCNHTYLIKGAEEQILVERRAMAGIDPEDSVTQEFVNEALIRSAGKTILLDKLLAKLKTDGHRVLIFSQMTQMLDILQDYLTYKGYFFERIDGAVRGEDRQSAIDRFNAPDSKDFVFLLCTHAGGLGINLASADTVIIYDSDWNPQNDIQATARCHRIGQTKEVKVYRFITANSYERKLFDRASIKLGLDHAVLESSKIGRGEEIEKLLRLGAYHAFEDDEGEAEKFGEEDIETILSRSTTIRHQNVADNSTFSKAQFEIDESEERVDLADPEFWKKYLPVVNEEESEDRRRPKRETEPPSPPSQKGSKWSRRKMQTLMGLLWRYGWGRWRVIYEAFDFKCPISDVKSVSRVILKWLLDSAPNQFPIIDAIYKMSSSEDGEDFEKKFARKHKAEFESAVISNNTWKLQRLELLYFLNSEVQSCPDAPDGLVVPSVLASRPADWWTPTDDKLLLHGAYTNGFMQFSDIKFTQNERPANKALSARLRVIIYDLRNSYASFKEANQIEVPFSNQTLKMLYDKITKADHRAIIFHLINFGFTTVEELANICDLTSKAAFESYINDMIEHAEKGDEQQGGLVEKLALSQCQKIQGRISLFKRVREFSLDNLKEEDKALMEFVSEHGFLDLAENPKMVEMLGRDGIEGKAMKRLKEIMKQTEKRRTVKVPTLTIPRDSEGHPTFPIKLSSNSTLISIGKVVFDRQGFHCERYIYPSGYICERLFPSTDDPREKVWYVCEIEDNGGEAPVFKVRMKEKPEICFEGSAPSNPWHSVLKAVEEKRKELNEPGNKAMTISGPDYFGLASNIVIKLMQEMENVDKCTKFIKRDFNAPAEERKIETRKKNSEIRYVGDSDEEEEEEIPKKRPKPKPTILRINFKPLLERAGAPQTPDLSFDLPSVLQPKSLHCYIQPEFDGDVAAILEKTIQKMVPAVDVAKVDE